MDGMNIFLLEDQQVRIDWFFQQCPDWNLVVAKNVETAYNLLLTGPYDIIFLDHDLLPEHHNPETFGDISETTGYAVAKWLAEHHEISLKALIVLHSVNQVGAARMLCVLHDAKRRVVQIPWHILVTYTLKNILSK